MPAYCKSENKYFIALIYIPQEVIRVKYDVHTHSVPHGLHLCSFYDTIQNVINELFLFNFIRELQLVNNLLS
jgi:hypothetical protein